MKKRFKIVWTRQSQEDLRAIRGFIGRDSPISADSFIHRLRAAVERLRQFPESGQMVPELLIPSIREICYGDYRLKYRFRGDMVEMLTVFHGARLFEIDQLPDTQ